MDPFGTGKLVLFQGGILNIVPGSFLYGANADHGFGVRVACL